MIDNSRKLHAVHLLPVVTIETKKAGHAAEAADSDGNMFIMSVYARYGYENISAGKGGFLKMAEHIISGGYEI